VQRVVEMQLGVDHGNKLITRASFRKNVSSRQFVVCAFYSFILLRLLVKNLMYGFGDDRNPGNDTVNVMEEILIEFIIDVVCIAVQMLEAGF
jgi:hypothetical protein